jgi:hypothetical protein
VDTQDNFSGERPGHVQTQWPGSRGVGPAAADSAAYRRARCFFFPPLWACFISITILSITFQVRAHPPSGLEFSGYRPGVHSYSIGEMSRPTNRYPVRDLYHRPDTPDERNPRCRGITQEISDRGYPLTEIKDIQYHARPSASARSPPSSMEEDPTEWHVSSVVCGRTKKNRPCPLSARHQQNTDN